MSLRSAAGLGDSAAPAGRLEIRTPLQAAPVIHG